MAGSPTVALQVPRIRPDTADIFHLATAGDIEGMKNIFERGLASPNDVSHTFGFSVLHHAIDLEHVDMIRFLLEQDADPELSNRRNLTATDFAWNRILSRRMDPCKISDMSCLFSNTNREDQIESRGLTRLQQIILGLVNEDLSLLLKNLSVSMINAKDSDGNTVLSWSARCGNEDATRLLLRHGADYSPTSRFGSTALHYAAAARSPSCLHHLLEAGADPNVRNPSLHETPLHAAALRHDEPETFLGPLVQHRGDVHARDHEGSSVLAFAVQANHCRSARYLLDNGADTDIDVADQGGLTPLGLAVMYKHNEIVTMLLENGASVTPVTKTEETLLHLCAQYGDRQTIDALAQVSENLCPDALDANGLKASAYARLRGSDFENDFNRLLLGGVENQVDKMAT